VVENAIFKFWPWTNIQAVRKLRGRPRSFSHRRRRRIARRRHVERAVRSAVRTAALQVNREVALEADRRQHLPGQDDSGRGPDRGGECNL
jgi:hypothetical protein